MELPILIRALLAIVVFQVTNRKHKDVAKTDDEQENPAKMQVSSTIPKYPIKMSTNYEGGTFEGAKEVKTILTGYYPDTISDDESGMMDMKGNRLQTLQDYLDGRAPYVTVSTDPRLNVPYGTRVIIPSLDRQFGVKNGIRFEARDAGPHMEGAGFSRLDVCVRSEQDSYDVAVNRAADALFVFPPK